MSYSKHAQIQILLTPHRVW